MKKIRITNTVFGVDSFGNTVEQLAAGALYAIDDEAARRQLVRGNAIEVDVLDETASARVEQPAAIAVEATADAAVPTAAPTVKSRRAQPAPATT